MKTTDIERRIADLVAINPRPQQPRALVAMGQEMIVRDVDAATKCFDKALAIDPRFVPAWVARCEALCLMGRKGQAVGCLERALDVEPKNTDLAERKKQLLQELALASSRNRRFDPPSSSNPVAAAAPSSSRAVADAAKAPPKIEPKSEPKVEPKSEPKVEPKSEPKPEPKPKVEAKPEPKPESEPKPEAKPEPKPAPKSDPKPAEIELEASRRVPPKSDPKPESPPESTPESTPDPASQPKPLAPLDPAFDEATTLLASGRHIEALRKIQPLTKQPDASCEVWMLRGAICVALDQLDEANISYERATKADAKSVPAWEGLAKARLKTKRLEPALDAADQALRLAPFDGMVQKLRGKILFALKQESAAAMAFEKATQHAPDDAEAWLELGRALHATRKTDGARQALQRALSIAETMAPDLVPAVSAELAKLK